MFARLHIYRGDEKYQSRAHENSLRRRQVGATPPTLTRVYGAASSCLSLFTSLNKLGLRSTRFPGAAEGFVMTTLVGSISSMRMIVDLRAVAGDAPGMSENKILLA